MPTRLLAPLFCLCLAACSKHATDSVSDSDDAVLEEVAQALPDSKPEPEPEPAMAQRADTPAPIPQPVPAIPPAIKKEVKAQEIPVPAAPAKIVKPTSQAPRWNDVQAPPTNPPNTRIGSAFDLPTGGSVNNLQEKVETARQLIDHIGIVGLEHVARMRGEAADDVGNMRVDLAGEKAEYMQDLDATYLSLRTVMADVARCPNPNPTAPTMNWDSPANRIKAEMDRYRTSGATAREADAHRRALEPIIMRFKSLQVDDSNLIRAGKDPNYPVPPAIRGNWCGR